jgi:hypothetical protein
VEYVIIKRIYKGKGNRRKICLSPGYKKREEAEEGNVLGVFGSYEK